MFQQWINYSKQHKWGSKNALLNTMKINLSASQRHQFRSTSYNKTRVLYRTVTTEHWGSTEGKFC